MLTNKSVRSYKQADAPVEMTSDAAFSRRILRLAATSCIALGLIWWLEVSTVGGPWPIGASLLVGWVLMPSLLTLSLRWPRLRYGLVLPSSAVTLPLIAVTVSLIGGALTPLLGWALITTGILMGGMLGLWFWFRLAPVPPALHAPFSRGRLTLIAIHIGSILAGLALVVWATV